MTKKSFPATEYLILLLAAGVRFYRLGAQSLWSDEGNSVAMAHRTFADIAARTAHDIHPPLYYWLLKIWVAFWGDSEFAVRALSAVAGVLLVAVVFRIGKNWFGRWSGLAAALLAAVNPFQIYYAQEARMYILLTLLGAAAMFFAWQSWRGGKNRWLVAYALAATAGLYTHYAFPVMLAAINVAALVALWRQKRALIRWISWQFVPVLAFAPWLPIALRQITTWPQSLLTPATPAEKLLTIAQYLAFGIAAPAVDSRWLWVFGIAFLVSGFGYLISRFTSHASRAIPPKLFTFHYSLFTLIWLLLPAGLTFFLFRPAYLKFLLVASPAFLLFLVQGLRFRVQRSRFIHNSLLTFHVSLFIALLIPSILSLRATYFDPAFQRDNYRGIAATIRALGTENDTVILHAPGQAEVFGYYFRGDDDSARVVALPHQRPINPAETISELKNIAAASGRIFGVFWATEEADPDAVIEGWLNKNTFKASDVWFGNVRLVQFAPPAQTMDSFSVAAQFGDAIALTGFQLPPVPVSPGDILQVGLQWQATQSPKKNYTVFVQVLDAENHLVGQRDAAPQPPTSNWNAGDAIDDRHGVQILSGTPPGQYRLVVGLYDAATGERLPLPDGRNFLELATISVEKNAVPLPADAFSMQHRVDAPPLVGFDVYKLGHASEPDAPIHPGDALHINLFWQAKNSRGGTAEIRLEGGGDSHVVWQGTPIPGYPISDWQAGEIVRQQLDIISRGWNPGRYRLVVRWSGKTISSGSTIDLVP